MRRTPRFLPWPLVRWPRHSIWRADHGRPVPRGVRVFDRPVGPVGDLVAPLNDFSDMPFDVPVRIAGLVCNLSPKIPHSEHLGDIFNGGCIIKRTTLEILQDDVLKPYIRIIVAFEGKIVVQRKSKFSQGFIRSSFSCPHNGKYVFPKGVPEKGFQGPCKPRQPLDAAGN